MDKKTDWIIEAVVVLAEETLVAGDADQDRRLQVINALIAARELRQTELLKIAMSLAGQGSEKAIAFLAKDRMGNTKPRE
jgi:hypothetical protein